MKINQQKLLHLKKTVRLKKNNRVSVTSRTTFSRINIHKIKVPEVLRKNGTEKNM